MALTISSSSSTPSGLLEHVSMTFSILRLISRLISSSITWENVLFPLMATSFLYTSSLMVIVFMFDALNTMIYKFFLTLLV